jgi:aldose sugar dehydrogenase
MQTPRRYAPMGGSFAPVWVAGFTWNGWQASAVYAVYESEQHSYTLQSIVGDLYFPFSIAPLPNGDILYTEKTIGLTLLSADGKEKNLIKGTPKIFKEATPMGVGLVGSGWINEVAIHPDYNKNGWIYLSYGDRCSDCNQASRNSGKPVSMLLVVRGRVENGRWVDEQTIWRTDIEHYVVMQNQMLGARLTFDESGHLYFTIGSSRQERISQNLDNPFGKVHRVRDNGRIPPDNPFLDNPQALPSIWSTGHRNSQGLEFNIRSGELWQTEHGPRGGDELNLIRPALNYGWPMVSFGMNYDGTPMNYVEEFNISYDPKALTYPVKHWTPSPALSSLVFYHGKTFPKWQDKLFVATLRKRELMLLTLEGQKVVKEEKLLTGLGRFRDIEVGADGTV